ncbi:MAG: stage III sporulation protein AB [Oscillospiraceae bacterium]|nr:stage III sporulation protein AB [Oscillospiraceae bacterium]
MIRLLGCLLIMFSSVCIGLNYINMLRKRVGGISAMIELLSALKIKISYEFSALPELLMQMQKNATDTEVIFLNECVTSLKRGDDLKSAWCAGVSRVSEQMHLTKSDTDILNEFSICLGDSDVSGQISNIQLYTEMLKKNLRDAEGILKEKSKVTLSCSLFGGLIFFVLLI